jgi:hypothetical protein
MRDSFIRQRDPLDVAEVRRAPGRARTPYPCSRTRTLPSSTELGSISSGGILSVTWIVSGFSLLGS